MLSDGTDVRRPLVSVSKIGIRSVSGFMALVPAFSSGEYGDPMLGSTIPARNIEVRITIVRDARPRPTQCHVRSAFLLHVQCVCPWDPLYVHPIVLPLVILNHGYSPIKYTLQLDSTFGFAIRIRRTRCGRFGIVPLSLCGILGPRCGLNQSTCGFLSFSSQPRYMQGI